MKRLLLIITFAVFSTWAFAQEETRVVDSLWNVVVNQEGREKVKTMMELSNAFFDFSFDDCIDWGEKAIKEAHALGLDDLEADAVSALGMHYGNHLDLDLEQEYHRKAFDMHKAVNDDSQALEDLWYQAYFELMLGNIDSAIIVYEKVLFYADQLKDSLTVAKAYANMAVIQYQKHDFIQSEVYFKRCRSLYVSLENDLEVARSNANLANLYMEWGKYVESRKLYREAISAFEDLERYDFLLLVYKNYGLLFEKDYVNYDSASFYFEKAMTCVNQVDWPTGSLEEVVNAKADLLVEMGNLSIVRDDESMAKKHLEEAFSLAESNSYHFGMMQAALSLGQLYATQGKASLSLHYLDIYAEESRKSGITMMEPATKKPLILDYARLGRFDEMAAELEAFDEQQKALQRETNDLYEQISSLQDETQWLRSKYETQDNKIETLQSQRNHYRLAFFGLLALVLFTIAVLIAYKIVRKNRVKNVKS